MFDPLTEAPLPAELAGFPATLAMTPGEPDFFLLQSSGSTDDAWLAAIRSRGGDPLGYVRNACTFVRAAQGTRALFDDIATRRATVDLLPAHRLTRSAEAAWQDPMSVEPWPDGGLRVEAVLMRDEAPADYQSAILTRIDGGCIAEESLPADPASGRQGMLRLRCDSDAKLQAAIEEMCRTPAIQAVSIANRAGMDDPWASAFHQTDIVSLAPPTDQFTSLKLFGHALTGAGEILAVVDYGFISEVCPLRWDDSAGAVPALAIRDPLPPAGSPILPLATVTPLNKIIAHYRDGYVDPINDPGHGTMMATVSAGDTYDCLATADSPWKPGNCSGAPAGLEHDHPSDGVAPGVQLVLAEADSLQISPFWAEAVHRQLYDTAPGPGLDGPRVYNSSTSEPRQVGSYGPIEAGLDEFAALNRDYTIFHSIGNDGIVEESRNHPADMKGGISVGATSDVGFRTAAGFGQDLWLEPGVQPNTGQGSSRGPGDWFRVKPDLVAAAGVNFTTHWPSVFRPCGSASFIGGTSAASATAAGLGIVTRQYVRQGFYPTGSSCEGHSAPGFAPTNALVKALLINSTRNLRGTGTADAPAGFASAPRPTFGQGWGYPVLGDSLFLPGDPLGSGAVERTYMLILTDTPNGLESGLPLNDDRAAQVVKMSPAIREGEVHEFVVRVGAGEDLHVTLAWTDQPGAQIAADPLIADLDLEIIAPEVGGHASVWRPNAGASSGADAFGTPVDRARAWRGGYTVLGPALCGDAPLGNEVPDLPGYPIVEYEDCGPQPACPTGEPQFWYEQAATPPFSCFHHRDPVNTVENVFIRASDIVPGDYRIRVIGFEIPADMSAVTVFARPDFTNDGVPDGDLIRRDRQGYALVASGRVSADKGFVHLNQAHYLCGDQVVATVVDRNLTAPTSVSLELAADMVTVTCDVTGVCPPVPVELRRAGDSVDPSNGILEIVEGATDTLTATYADSDPPNRSSVACASTGPLLTLAWVTASDACGDADGSIEPGELVFLDMAFRNDSVFTLSSVMAILSQGGDGSDPQIGSVVLSPLPLPPLGIATARVPVIVGGTCPLQGNIEVKLVADGRSCDMKKVLFDTGPQCSFTGVNPTPPGEVPDGSVRVTKVLGQIQFDWDPPPGGADLYNVYRGQVVGLAAGGFADPRYSHVRSIAVDAGICGLGTELFVDRDDMGDGVAYYYLVTAARTCGLEGTPGFDFFAAAGGGLPGRQRAAGSGCP